MFCSVNLVVVYSQGCATPTLIPGHFHDPHNAPYLVNGEWSQSRHSVWVTMVSALTERLPFTSYRAWCFMYFGQSVSHPGTRGPCSPPLVYEGAEVQRERVPQSWDLPLHCF